jgi:hypothetical protein
MKRLHIDMSNGEVRDLDDPLETLGLSKRKYLWDTDDTEDVREKREADLTDELRRMIQ